MWLAIALVRNTASPFCRDLKRSLCSVVLLVPKYSSLEIFGPQNYLTSAKIAVAAEDNNEFDAIFMFFAVLMLLLQSPVSLHNFFFLTSHGPLK